MKKGKLREWLSVTFFFFFPTLWAIFIVNVLSVCGDSDCVYMAAQTGNLIERQSKVDFR